VVVKYNLLPKSLQRHCQMADNFGDIAITG